MAGKGACATTAERVDARRAHTRFRAHGGLHSGWQCTHAGTRQAPGFHRSRQPGRSDGEIATVRSAQDCLTWVVSMSYKRSPLGETLGRERMFFNLEQAIG